MKRDNKPTILLENKNYDKNVGQDEVLKFLRDVETQLRLWDVESRQLTSFALSTL